MVVAFVVVVRDVGVDLQFTSMLMWCCKAMGRLTDVGDGADVVDLTSVVLALVS